MKRLLMSLLLVLAVAGCKTDLYTDLTEYDANEMLDVLLREGIAAQKSGLGDGIFTVTVQEDEVRRALAILRAEGLPTRNHDSIGDVFSKSGIVSSPFEERIRYIYALGEELSLTLQQIDGVKVARVHIVMPEEPELGQEAQPSSAAVFIKQKPGYDLDFLMPQIRRLVANAIEAVEYEAVTIILTQTAEVPESSLPAAAETVSVWPGMEVGRASVGTFYAFTGTLGALILALAAALVAVFRRSRKKTSVEESDDEDDL